MWPHKKGDRDLATIGWAWKKSNAPCLCLAYTLLEANKKSWLCFSASVACRTQL